MSTSVEDICIHCRECNKPMVLKDKMDPIYCSKCLPLFLLPPKLVRQSGIYKMKPLACSCGCGRREGEPPRH